MPQLLLGCNAISDQSLQFLRLRKSAFLLTGKDDLAFESDVQDASLARNKCDSRYFHLVSKVGSLTADTRTWSPD